MNIWKTLDIDFAIIAFSSLFSIINPISTAPIFVGMTEGVASQRKRIAWTTTLASGVTLALFAVAGGAIFAFFGITVPAFQIAGGILFTLMSIQTLINGKDDETHEMEGSDPSVVPLAIPMIAGPGAISTVMVLVGQAQNYSRFFGLAIAILLNVILTLVVLLASPWIVKWIGVNGKKIVNKVMGLITAVIGIQFVINGVTTIVIDILKSARG
jgi:multiple antibiotic resistance protein